MGSKIEGRSVIVLILVITRFSGIDKITSSHEAGRVLSHTADIRMLLKANNRVELFEGALVGAWERVLKTFGSTCHGAGIRLSRHAAQRASNVAAPEKELTEREIDIHIRAGSTRGVSEEAPIACKDMKSDRNAGLAKRVAETSYCDQRLKI
jgi:RNA-splicing ligase RtcB